MDFTGDTQYSIRIGIPATDPGAPGFSTLELAYDGLGQDPSGNLARLLATLPADTDFSLVASSVLVSSIDIPRDSSYGTTLLSFRKIACTLSAAGHLCSVLLPFPFTFRYEASGRRHLDRLLKDLAGFPLAVEFRSAEWFSSRVIEGLKERRVGLCVSDFPRLPGYPPLSDLVTAELACVRLHGRNSARSSCGTGFPAAAAVGEVQGSAKKRENMEERQEYRYSHTELSGWVLRLSAMAREARILRVYAVTGVASAEWNATALSLVPAPSGHPEGRSPGSPPEFFGAG